MNIQHFIKFYIKNTLKLNINSYEYNIIVMNNYHIKYKNKKNLNIYI